MSGVNVFHGASWSEEPNGKILRGAACDLEPRGSPFSRHHLHGESILFHLLQMWYADFKGVV